MENDIKDILNEYEIKDDDRDDLSKELADYTKQAILDNLGDIKSYLNSTEWDLKH